MVARKKILVTGANGQLGQSLLKIADKEKYDYFFMNKSQLDITDLSKLAHFFEQHHFDYCLNFAAYTNVEKAENDKKMAYKINKESVGQLAQLCHKNNTVLFHISTDYVFDGKKKKPYKEEDIPAPINVYGESKLEGEKELVKHTDKFFILRTSWLYSDMGKNFYKTILDLANKKKELKIVYEQIGTPTLTYDLLNFILFLINNEAQEYGLYHFSNAGEASWFDFAKQILFLHQLDTEVIPVNKDEFPTIAARPVYSVLDKRKIKAVWDYTPVNWKQSLENLIKKT